jgi:hypothetical protein
MAEVIAALAFIFLSKKNIFHVHAKQACRRSIGIVPKILLSLSSWWKRVISFTFWPLYPQEKKAPTSIKQDSGWIADTVLAFRKRDKSMAPAGTGIPDRPVHNLNFCIILNFKLKTRLAKIREGRWRTYCNTGPTGDIVRATPSSSFKKNISLILLSWCAVKIRYTADHRTLRFDLGQTIEKRWTNIMSRRFTYFLNLGFASLCIIILLTEPTRCSNFSSLLLVV